MGTRELYHQPKHGKPTREGISGIVPQGKEFFIHGTPRVNIPPDHPSMEKLKWALSEYDPKIGPTGDVRLYVPKNHSYGRVLKLIARAYHEARLNPYPEAPPPTQTQLTREAR